MPGDDIQGGPKDFRTIHGGTVSDGTPFRLSVVGQELSRATRRYQAPHALFIHTMGDCVAHPCGQFARLPPRDTWGASPRRSMWTHESIARNRWGPG